MGPLPRTAVCLAAAAAVIAAAASAGADAQPPRATAASGSALVRVRMRHNRFHPHRIDIQLGTRIRWINRDRRGHTVASAKLRLASDVIHFGETFRYRPRRRGRYPYYCTIHAGQTGVIVVH